jgi:membrane protein implicated in regulation of membrane protease activity
VLLPPVDVVREPVSHEPAPPRASRAPTGLLLLFLGFAALGGAIGLLAAGRWPLGLVLLGVAMLLLVGVFEAMRHRAPSQLVRHSRSLARRREGVEARTLGRERGPALQDLGDAVWRGDAAAEKRARERLAELDRRGEGQDAGSSPAP